MNNYCMIEVAFGSKKEVDASVKELLNKKLVASCQVVESNSFWNWDDKNESGKEWLLFLKTKKNLSEEIYNVVKGIHSYECFELAIFVLESCNDDYIKWIERETK